MMIEFSWAMRLVSQERTRQLALWGDQSSNSMFEWLSLLGEENGELCEAVNETYSHSVTHPERGGVMAIRREAVHVAAVAMAIVEATISKSQENPYIPKDYIDEVEKNAKSRVKKEMDAWRSGVRAPVKTDAERCARNATDFRHNPASFLLDDPLAQGDIPVREAIDFSNTIRYHAYIIELGKEINRRKLEGKEPAAIVVSSWMAEQGKLERMGYITIGNPDILHREPMTCYNLIAYTADIDKPYILLDDIKMP